MRLMKNSMRNRKSRYRYEKKRIAILSSGGDIFLSSLVLKLFKERFYDEIDEMFVCYNNHAQIPLSVAQEFIKNVMEEPKARIVYYPMGVGNGVPIKQGVLLAPDDSLILLLEDDGWVFTQGKINECFERIESGETDLLGSPRGSCGQEIWNAAQTKYNLDYTGEKDVGPTWWPNFLFCKRKDLLRTDLNFASKEYKAGEYVKEIDHTMVETQYSDTFAFASLQLRYLGIRSEEIPQFHCSPTEMADKQLGKMNWRNNQSPYWLHVGSLSSGFGGYLSGQIPDVSTDMAKWEIETRVAGWKIACDLTEGYVNFRKEYLMGIEDLIQNAKLDNGRIQAKYSLYRSLLRM